MSQEDQKPSGMTDPISYQIVGAFPQSTFTKRSVLLSLESAYEACSFVAS